jgi:transcriptional regulator with XRE-family HTH domain
VGIFARNLREAVVLKGTIAQACSATGINRQQFNKYLSGQITPGTRSLRKICSYLGVTEQQLLTGQDSGVALLRQTIPSEIDLGTLPPALASILSEGWGQHLPIPDAYVLPLGFYDCYFPSHAAPGLVVRWLVQIKQGAGGQVYTGRTRVSDLGRVGYLAPRLKYQGAVLYGSEEACLIGTTAQQSHHPAVMSISTVPVLGRTYYSALALARRADGPLAMMAGLHYRGSELPPRAALAGLGLVSLDEPDLDPVIVKMMRAKPVAGSNWMQSVNEESLQTGSGGSELPEALAVRRLSI